MKVGMGYDIHRLAAGRKLLLGGIEVPADRGEEGFSDGDALTHAVIDSLLGPAGLGDIGSNFPAGQEEYRNISSRTLLRRTQAMLAAAGFIVENVDCVVALEAPKILPYIPAIRGSLAEDMGIAADRVTVKGKTSEGLDAVGAGLAVAAWAVSLLRERASS
jgi:2-C-methyl-D-erythritol 2,4-cyclodiphosphate synthase